MGDWGPTPHFIVWQTPGPMVCGTKQELAQRTLGRERPPPPRRCPRAPDLAGVPAEGSTFHCEPSSRSRNPGQLPLHLALGLAPSWRPFSKTPAVLGPRGPLWLPILGQGKGEPQGAGYLGGEEHRRWENAL